MAENKLLSKFSWTAEIVRRLPRATARALAAAAAEFTATLTRPIPPRPGSAEDLEQFGITSGQFMEALRMLVEGSAVRPGKLRARFGNAPGTNLLSYCEIRGFISKPQGGPWQVDSERVSACLGARDGLTAIPGP